MVRLTFWDIGLRKRQERVGVGGTGSNVDGVNGDGGAVRSCPSRRNRRRSANGKSFYGADVAIGSLSEKPQVS